MHDTTYEPPTIEILGSVEDLTAGVKGGPDADGGGGSTTFISDRALKEQLEPVDHEAILERAVQVRTAPEFAAAFGVGDDPTRIHPIDMNGVALASIKALKATVDRQQAELERLRAELERRAAG